MIQDLAFRPRWPWIGPDLQTLRDTLAARPERMAAALAARPGFERATIELGDGDALSAAVDPAAGAARGTLVLIHGLTGCEGGPQMVALALAATSAGWRVLRLNLRGAGPSARISRGHYHAGRTDDLAAALGWVRARFNGPLGAVGYSLGGQALLRHLGEAGAEAAVDFAASVSAPIDLAASARRLARPRNWVYARWLLKRMKAESRAEQSRLDQVDSLYAFDDLIVAPDNGFVGADDYYARCASGPVISQIAKPTLLLMAQDDPWIAFPPYADLPETPAITPLYPRQGGHVGFHGRGDGGLAWRDRALLAWADQASASATSGAK